MAGVCLYTNPQVIADILKENVYIGNKPSKKDVEAAAYRRNLIASSVSVGNDSIRQPNELDEKDREHLDLVENDEQCAIFCDRYLQWDQNYKMFSKIGDESQRVDTLKEKQKLGYLPEFGSGPQLSSNRESKDLERFETNLRSANEPPTNEINPQRERKYCRECELNIVHRNCVNNENPIAQIEVMRKFHSTSNGSYSYASEDRNTNVSAFKEL